MRAADRAEKNKKVKRVMHVSQLRDAYVCRQVYYLRNSCFKFHCGFSTGTVRYFQTYAVREIISTAGIRAC